ncbi:hypothetical protein D3C76_1774060 [compost metagenome]
MDIRRFNDQQLAAETHRAAADKRLVGADAGGVHRMAGFHIVAAVQNEIGALHGAVQGFALQPLLQRNGFNHRVQCL